MNGMMLGLALLLAAPQGTAPSPEFEKQVRVGEPITRGNITVFPLTLRHAPAAPDPLTLDEAVARKQLAIEESGQGSVNTLAVENRGDRAVVLVTGELLLGGKQDRIVGRSVVLAPRARARVAVFCVEHGRWSGARSFESGGAMGHVDLRKSALAGDQSAVWSEVARSNARLGTANASDTYRAAARKLGGEAGPTAREIASEVARVPGAAGLAVAIDGEVVAVEWFASPRLFERLRDKLVASYVAQARTTPAPTTARPASPPRAAAVADFAGRAEKGEALVDEAKEAGAAAPVQTTYLRR